MMTTKPINERQKKFLLIVPLLTIPFLVLFFWALGGGKNAQVQNAKQTAGLNMQLPGAKLKTDSTENKLSLYQQAEKDSLQFRESQKNDPYYHADTTVHAIKNDSLHKYDTGILPKDGPGLHSYPGFGLSNTTNSLSVNEQKVNEKLTALKQQLNQPQPLTPATVNTSAEDDAALQLKKLQLAMQHNDDADTPDPQMKQLSEMLDKIKDIQNPGMARQKMKEESEKNRGQVFAVTGPKKENMISTLDGSGISTAIPSNGFYSLDDNANAQDNDQNTIEAVIAQTQTLVNGSTVKLKLVNDIYINGSLIPQNTFVFGTAELSGERLGIKINSIRYQRSLYPVSLSVYDMDGMAGIYIPGAITRDVAKESTDQGIQSLGVMSYDPSIGAQAATAGISAAKTLFSRKVRLIKVNVKAGYQVLLRDEKQKQLNN